MINPNITKAIYTKTQIEEYDNNIFTAALGHNITDTQKTLEKLVQYPKVSSHELKLPSHKRKHLVFRLRNYFLPFGWNIQLDEMISYLIMNAYVASNPETGMYQAQLHNGYARIEANDIGAQVNNHINSTASFHSLFGFSGCGKSKSIERSLSCYPQAIEHEKHNIIQIPYLKLNCPINGDLNDLCDSFFNGVDEILNSKYQELHSRKKSGISTKIAKMGQIAKLHAIGLLVIDEIQNLNESKSGGAKKMQNFFVEMVNNIGVSVLQVGTFRAKNLFRHSFSAARRSTINGSSSWERMKNDENWKILMDNVSPFQWLRNAKNINNELADHFYDLTQGIVAVFISLYALSQLRAIDTGKEQITKKLLSKVYKDSFGPIHEMLSAIKSNDIEKLSEYDDVISLEVEKIMLNSYQKVKESERLKKHPMPKFTKEDYFVQIFSDMGIEPKISLPFIRNVLAKNKDLEEYKIIYAILNEIQSNKPKSLNIEKTIKQKDWDTLDKVDLRSIYENNKDLDMHTVFKERGVIFDIESFLKAEKQ